MPIKAWACLSCLLWVYQYLLVRAGKFHVLYFYSMKKQKTTTFFVITFYFIWGIITFCLVLSLFFDLHFFIKLILTILSFVFLILLLFYFRRLWSVCTREGKELNRLNNELEKALEQTARQQVENKQKEILLNAFLKEIHKGQ